MAKKRANGEGSIRKRADGRWEGRYTARQWPGPGSAAEKDARAQRGVYQRRAPCPEQLPGTGRDIEVAPAKSSQKLCPAQG